MANLQDMEMKTKETQFNEDGTSYSQLSHYFSNGQSVRLDVQRISPDSPAETLNIVWVVTPEGRFIIHRKEGVKEYVVDSIGSVDRVSEESTESVMAQMYSNNALPFSPFTIGQDTILDYTQLPGFRFNSAEVISGDSPKQLIKLSYQLAVEDPDDKNKKRLTGGWLVFCPDEEWALHEAYFIPFLEERPDVGILFEINYSDKTVGKTPIPSAIREWAYVKGEKKTLRREVEALEIMARPSPTSVFKLSEFNLSDSMLQPATRSQGWLWFLIIGNVLLIICVIILARFAKKKKSE
ncbi:MAG: hypothetical protein R3C11_27720 [Planctomycetaceae bacterium]